MGRLLKPEEGRALVAAARSAIGRALGGPPADALPSTGIFGEPRGVFVSLHTHPGHELRGCIGAPLGREPLGRSLPRLALASAMEDPRFSPLRAGELSGVVLEVSVLSVPEAMEAADPASREKSVRIGRDGLIIEYGQNAGLLLPQVALEWNWKPREFLEAVCQKAGLPGGMWKSASARLYTFGAQIFAEETPGGKAAERRLIRG